MSVFESTYPILQEPVIEFPKYQIYHQEDTLPKGIEYSAVFELTPGKIVGSTSELPPQGQFEAVTAYPIISDQLLNTYRGLYFEDSLIPVQDPSPYEVLPSNYELNLSQITYPDGSLVNEGLASQLLFQRASMKNQLLKKEEFDYRQQGLIEMANHVADIRSGLLDQFSELKKMEISDELEVISNRKLIKQKKEVFTASSKLGDLIRDFETLQRTVDTRITIDQSNNINTELLENINTKVEVGLSRLRDHLIGEHDDDLPQVVEDEKVLLELLTNMMPKSPKGSKSGMLDRKGIFTMNKTELKKKAKEMGIGKTSTMSVPELKHAILVKDLIMLSISKK